MIRGIQTNEKKKKLVEIVVVAAADFMRTNEFIWNRSHSHIFFWIINYVLRRLKTIVIDAKWWRHVYVHTMSDDCVCQNFAVGNHWINSTFEELCVCVAFSSSSFSLLSFSAFGVRLKSVNSAHKWMLWNDVVNFIV